MPTYYFDVYDHRQISCDAFGDEFANDDEASDQAAAILPALATDALPGGDSHDFGALVRDDDGRVVFRALLFYRGHKPDDMAYRWRVSVSDLQCEITRSIDLRRHAREMGRSVQDSARDMMALLEEVRATMEVSAGLVGRAMRRGAD